MRKPSTAQRFHAIFVLLAVGIAEPCTAMPGLAWFCSTGFSLCWAQSARKKPHRLKSVPLKASVVDNATLRIEPPSHGGFMELS